MLKIEVDILTFCFLCSQFLLLFELSHDNTGFPGGASDKESVQETKGYRFDSWVGKTPWSRNWQPTPVFLPGESHGLQSMGSQRVKHE